MGSSAVTAISVGLCLVLVSVYFASDSYRIFQNVLVSTGLNENSYVKRALNFLELNEENQDSTKTRSNVKEATKITELLLTSEELKSYDGGPDSKGLYLAILGEVFDVQKGAQHYKPGGGYGFFAGKDATRAYITGDFSEEGLIDDVSDLDSKSLASLEDWLSFYKEEYEHAGKLIGRYYNKNGQPTKELLSIRQKMNSVKENKYTETKNKEVFPPCNSEWSKEKGSKVWCTKRSGGVDRKWVGVPRELHVEGKDPRCVCVKNSGPPSSDPNAHQHNDNGDLDHPGLREYPGCLPSSESCAVSHP
ncbi:Neuferricin [Araneus ventricosus]|uniref:Neuferricin n=1 Tax=Araneus ventricosus TaxID=182803 RepID=A0A4Y2SKC9_ARAVE|nr:Neuferricin [Araneus ventricosus]GBN88597.1 Neuferricin [Araneus ventricosus]